jgi:excisionase family DNA binding protein
MRDDLTALFVRVPKALSDDLAALAQQTGRTKQSVVTELLTTATTVPEERPPASQDDVLDLDGLCALLMAQPEDVLDRIANGRLPGRRLGSGWRFSRAAVMAWLAGIDSISDHPVGFSGPSA